MNHQKDTDTKWNSTDETWFLFGCVSLIVSLTVIMLPRTIWGFYDTKKKVYCAPINSTKHGNQVDIKDTRNYTAMQLNLNPLMAAFS